MGNAPRFKFHSVEESLKPDVEEKEEDNGILIHLPLLRITSTPLKIHAIKESVLYILLVIEQTEK